MLQAARLTCELVVLSMMAVLVVVVLSTMVAVLVVLSIMVVVSIVVEIFRSLCWCLWCGAHGCEEMRKSTREEVNVARFSIRRRQMMIMENMRRNHDQKNDKKSPEVDGKQLMVKLIMRMGSYL